MSDEDPLETRLALGWRALSPPAASMPRVRARVLGDAAASGGAGPRGARVERGADTGTRLASGGRWGARWHALKASGALGLVAGASLLALGLGVGFSLRPGASAHDAQPAAPFGSTSDAPRVDAGPLRPADPREADGALQTRGDLEAQERSRSAGGSRSSAQGKSSLAPAASPPAPRSTARSLPTARPPARGMGDAEELRVLERAERALRAANPELSLALLQNLDEARPHTRLLEERRALTLMALCRTAAPESTARAADFTRRYPSSVYAERISLDCAKPTKTSAPDMNSNEGDSHVKP